MPASSSGPAPEALPSARTSRTIGSVAVQKRCLVAAYCRVSTSGEDQEGSLLIQREHFLSVIAEHPDWTLVDIYYEQGLSGTSRDRRPELLRLLEDCRRGRVSLVLTKSISRFARNTTECLEMVRELASLGVRMVFEKENIDTRDVDSDFLLTLLASLAEEESHSFSENNRWTIQKRFQTATYRPSVAAYGYDLADGQFVINEKEAAVVREIIARYLAGEGPKAIKDSLNARDIPTKRAGEVWRGTVRSGVWRE